MTTTDSSLKKNNKTYINKNDMSPNKLINSSNLSKLNILNSNSVDKHFNKFSNSNRKSNDNDFSSKELIKIILDNTCFSGKMKSFFTDLVLEVWIEAVSFINDFLLRQGNEYSKENVIKAVFDKSTEYSNLRFNSFLIKIVSIFVNYLIDNNNLNRTEDDIKDTKESNICDFSSKYRSNNNSININNGNIVSLNNFNLDSNKTSKLNTILTNNNFISINNNLSYNSINSTNLLASQRSNQLSSNNRYQINSQLHSNKDIKSENKHSSVIFQLNHTKQSPSVEIQKEFNTSKKNSNKKSSAVSRSKNASASSNSKKYLNTVYSINHFKKRSISNLNEDSEYKNNNKSKVTSNSNTPVINKKHTKKIQFKTKTNTNKTHNNYINTDTNLIEDLNSNNDPSNTDKNISERIKHNIESNINLNFIFNNNNNNINNIKSSLLNNITHNNELTTETNSDYNNNTINNNKTSQSVSDPTNQLPNAIPNKDLFQSQFKNIILAKDKLEKLNLFNLSSYRNNSSSEPGSCDLEHLIHLNLKPSIKNKINKRQMKEHFSLGSEALNFLIKKIQDSKLINNKTSTKLSKFGSNKKSSKTVNNHNIDDNKEIKDVNRYVAFKNEDFGTGFSKTCKNKSLNYASVKTKFSNTSLNKNVINSKRSDGCESNNKDIDNINTDNSYSKVKLSKSNVGLYCNNNTKIINCKNHINKLKLSDNFNILNKKYNKHHKSHYVNDNNNITLIPFNLKMKLLSSNNSISPSNLNKKYNKNTKTSNHNRTIIDKNNNNNQTYSYYNTIANNYIDSESKLKLSSTDNNIIKNDLISIRKQNSFPHNNSSSIIKNKQKMSLINTSLSKSKIVSSISNTPKHHQTSYSSFIGEYIKTSPSNNFIHKDLNTNKDSYKLYSPYNNYISKIKLSNLSNYSKTCFANNTNNNTTTNNYSLNNISSNSNIKCNKKFVNKKNQKSMFIKDSRISYTARDGLDKKNNSDDLFKNEIDVVDFKSNTNKEVQEDKEDKEDGDTKYINHIKNYNYNNEKYCNISIMNINNSNNKMENNDDHINLNNDITDNMNNMRNKENSIFDDSERSSLKSIKTDNINKKENIIDNNNKECDEQLIFQNFNNKNSLNLNNIKNLNSNLNSLDCSLNTSIVNSNNANTQKLINKVSSQLDSKYQNLLCFSYNDFYYSNSKQQTINSQISDK